MSSYNTFQFIAWHCQNLRPVAVLHCREAVPQGPPIMGRLGPLHDDAQTLRIMKHCQRSPRSLQTCSSAQSFLPGNEQQCDLMPFEHKIRGSLVSATLLLLRMVYNHSCLCFINFISSFEIILICFKRKGKRIDYLNASFLLHVVSFIFYGVNVRVFSDIDTIIIVG